MDLVNCWDQSITLLRDNKVASQREAIKISVPFHFIFKALLYITSSDSATRFTTCCGHSKFDRAYDMELLHVIDVFVRNERISLILAEFIPVMNF